jgi:hypothetical protein
MYTVDLPTSPTTAIATFADDIAVLASQKLQTHLLANRIRRKTWRMQANDFTMVHVTFNTRSGTCPPVQMNVQLPCEDHVKYLGLHLDRKLTWQHNIFTKRKHLGGYSHQDVLVVGRKSQLSLSNKLLLYKTIFKLIWTFGIQLWGTASTSNIEILERFQSKALRMIDTPWYVPNTLIRRDLQIPSVKEEISNYSSHYSARLTAHPNDILLTLLEQPELMLLATCQTIWQLRSGN